MKSPQTKTNAKRLLCALRLAIPCILVSSIAQADPENAGTPAPELPTSLDKAILQLMREYPGYGKTGEALLKELQRHRDEGKGETSELRRRIAVSHPVLQQGPLLFTTRKQFKQDHHNTATLFQPNEINRNSYQPGRSFLKTIDLRKGGEQSTLVDPGVNGVVRDPEVSWGGESIVFSMRSGIDDSYHIHRCRADGSEQTQLTRARHVSDIDPVFLPNGHIVFTSTREPKYCMCNRHIMGNLFRMEADGANIHQIGKSTFFEGHSSLLPDGRILYDRWEYVDRNFGDAQGLWVTNPDGTNHTVYWGNNTASPGGVIDARAIPGSDLILCIFGSCHDRPWGALAIIDRKLGVDGREPVLRTWPADAIDKVGTDGGNKWDAFLRIQPKYEDPYPLDRNFFLCVRTMGKEETTGIYLIDIFGNETLIHSEEPGCFDPMMLIPRPAPRTHPKRHRSDDSPGTFYVQDCSIGTHMGASRKEDIKYLRVVETPEKRTWTHQRWGGQGTIAPSMNWHDFSNKRILGTVPVEEDGSANFEVPSDTFVFFQLLDKDRRMIHSMRSGTIVRPGEAQGCIGCHDHRVKDTPKSRYMLALQRPPSKLGGWYGKPRLFSYTREVQPVFDRHCVSCHDWDKPDNGGLILNGDRSAYFNASYMELHRKGLIQCVGGGPSQIQEAYSWGSHPSKLTQMLVEGHKEVSLNTEEMERIFTWVDLNAPYYPTYDSAYPENPTGRSPLTAAELKQLSQLTGAKFVANHRGNAGSQLSFDRPQKSPCLQSLEPKSNAYRRALDIIRKGSTRLRERPRADMPGFQPADYAVKRLQFYEGRKEQEKAVRKAIREGFKVYDE